MIGPPKSSDAAAGSVGSDGPRPPSIPDYELLRRIGAGGYGEVWLARSTATGALRAVKIVQRSTFTDARPFEREFEGLLKFEAVSRAHPSQLALFHVGRNESAGYFYYVMELADAAPVASDPLETPRPPRRLLNADSLRTDYSPRTLRSDLEPGRLPAARVLELGRALAEALAHLHGQGLVHRDVKPSNIIFVAGLPKLADIGLVTDASDVRSMVGTEGYLPLEGPGTPAADIFALGKVLYEALTGLDRRKFPELPADLRQWPDAALAFELNVVVVQACAADARQRYTTARAMEADLTRLATGGSVKRRRTWIRGGKWTAIAAGLAILTKLLVFSGIRFIEASRQREPAQATVGWTTNREAAKAYQLGDFFASKLMTPETLEVARKHLEEALRLDPNFAQAYGLLATLYNREPGWGTQLGKDAFPKARALAQRAIELAPGLAWVQGELACVYARFDYNWPAAEQASLKALALAPDNSGLHVGYAVQVLLPQRRFAEAQQHHRKAMDINPTDHLGPSNLGALYYYQRQFQEALAYFDQAVELEPTSETPRLFRARTLEAIPTRRPEAIREFKALLARPEAGKRVETTAGLAVVLARSGQEREARDLLAELLSHQDETCAAVSLAWVYTALGDHEKAIHWLEVGYERRDPWMIWIEVDPRLESLQGERKIRVLLKQLHLEP